MRYADPGFVTDELDRAAASGIDDRKAARHRFDHRARARVVDLRMQHHVRTSDESRRPALVIATNELHAVAQPELVEERLG